MRFHPFFNSISIKATKDILGICTLVKLLHGKLLYKEGDKSSSVYIILLGKVVIHTNEQGALGVLTMKNTVGEETQFSRVSEKLDSAYSEGACWLLEYDPREFHSLQKRMVDSGHRGDMLKFSRMV